MQDNAKYIMASNLSYQGIAPTLKYLIYPELVSDSTCLWTQSHKGALTSEASDK